MNTFKNIEEIINHNNYIPNNSIINANCLEAMKYIKDKSVDFILTDLPYNMLNKKSFDLPIDLVKLWEQYKRIIKDNGCIALFATGKFDKILGCSNLEMYKYEWIWEKTEATGFLNVKKRPLMSNESILIFYKKQPTYNPQMTTGHTPVHSFTKLASVSNKTEVYGKTNKNIINNLGSTERYPRTVLKFASDKQINWIPTSFSKTCGFM